MEGINRKRKLISGVQLRKKSGCPVISKKRVDEKDWIDWLLINRNFYDVLADINNESDMKMDDAESVCDDFMEIEESADQNVSDMVVHLRT